MLNAEQVKQYQVDGYVVIPSVFKPTIVQQMRDAVSRIVESSRTVQEHNSIYDLGPNHSAAKPSVRRIKQPHQVDPIFQQVMTDPNLLAMLQQLLGESVRIRNAKLNLKEPGGGEAVEWHQDWAFYPHTNDDVLAVGIMLDDCKMENGPLMIIPKSHQGPTYSHHDVDGYFCGAMDPTADGINFAAARPCIGPAGSVSFHHARAIHGSAANTSTSPRRLLLFEFAAGDAWPLLKNYNSLAEFNSWLLTGKASIVPRIVPAPVIMPLPPAVNQGSIYENQSRLKNKYFA